MSETHKIEQIENNNDETRTYITLQERNEVTNQV